MCTRDAIGVVPAPTQGSRAHATVRVGRIVGGVRGRSVKVRLHHCIAAAHPQCIAYNPPARFILAGIYRYANYLQLDVASPAAVTASTTGISVVQSVVELTATSAVLLVRLASCFVPAAHHACT